MWKNSLCVDPQCTARNRCCHMGPEGQLCFFDREKELCALLKMDWTPGLSFEILLDILSQRLNPESTEVEQLTSSIAQRMKPELRPHPLVELRDLAKSKDPSE